jgi:hypothetical protein
LILVKSKKNAPPDSIRAGRLGRSVEAAARRCDALRGDLVLVDEEIDLSVNVPADFERPFWHLTQKGLAEWDRLDAERSPA